MIYINVQWWLIALNLIAVRVTVLKTGVCVDQHVERVLVFSFAARLPRPRVYA